MEPTVQTLQLIPVILSGGSGTRLWPLSRALHPKQLQPLAGERTMLQDTVLRLSGLQGIEMPIVVSNEAHRFMVAEQLQEIGVEPASVILEPLARNTAPALAAAALEALAGGTDPLLLVLPADHAIQDTAAFHRAVLCGMEAAAAGRLVTFGIVPTEPATGYGYIQRGEPCEDGGGGVYGVERFVEKPDSETAAGYLERGGYYWNSGMFLLSASSYLKELAEHAPDVLGFSREAYAAAFRDGDFLHLDRYAFSLSPSISIDFAVMEKTAGAVVVPMEVGWSDVGAWSALWEIGIKDPNGNVLRGDVLEHGTGRCYIHSGSRLVAAVGVHDLVIVETPDAVLVAEKGSVQDVKRVVDALQDAGRDEAVVHRRVSRPWGYYQSVYFDERFKVKRISVKPGASLSLQKHHHRAEHWVVVKGTARIIKGEEEHLLTENQSIYIPLGVIHRLENPGVIPLELIEVQSGSYLEEDDIVRLDDSYGRISL